MECLECGERIVGRSDKKFCHDGCRNAYNNRNSKDANNLMRNIHNKLRKNYRVLQNCKFIEGKAKITKTQLVEQGFDFSYFTQWVTYKNGSQYRFLYDIGYKLLEEDWILVVKKEN